jgi:hypothetical protein
MATIITAPDLQGYLREPTADVTLLVDLANGVVSETLGTVPSPIPTRLRAITLEVAARAYRNPAGYASETVDDYTYRLPSETRKAGVYLTAAERAELLDTFGPSLAAAYTVPLGGADWLP